MYVRYGPQHVPVMDVVHLRTKGMCIVRGRVQSGGAHSV
jgi:hypothetical protein